MAACADGSCMCSGSISGGGLSCQRAAGGSAAITRGTCTAAVTGHTAEGVSLFGLDGEIMQAVATKPGAVASGCFPGQGKSAAAAVATVSSVGLELSIVSAVTGDVLSQEVEPALVKITPSGNQLGLAKVFGFILQGTPRCVGCCKWSAPVQRANALLYTMQMQQMQRQSARQGCTSNKDPQY